MTVTHIFKCWKNLRTALRRSREKSMKLHTPKGWLRNRIANSPDIDIAAGPIEAKLVSKLDSAVAKRSGEIGGESGPK